MLKFSMALLGATALLSTSGTAFAQHLQSSKQSGVELIGPASLNSNLCLLTLETDLTGSGPSSYDGGNNITGTNTPNPTPACVAITIVDGDFDVISSVSGSNAIEINDMVIDAGGTCNTGPFLATVTNINSSQIQVDVNEPSTGCGAISASLQSDPADGVQLVP